MSHISFTCSIQCHGTRDDRKLRVKFSTSDSFDLNSLRIADDDRYAISFSDNDAHNNVTLFFAPSSITASAILA